METSSPIFQRELAVAGRTSQGVELRGVPVSFNRHRVVFEVTDPRVVLRVSEVLGEFRLTAGANTLYTGRGLITNVMATGDATLCEASLAEASALTKVVPESTMLMPLNDAF